MAKKKTGRRGGRKPGVWELVKPEQIRAYREQNGLSRLKFAGMLGVSSTTVQNWETGKGAAVRSMQEKIKAALGGPPRVGATGGRGGGGGHAGDGYDSATEATGRIVAALLGSTKLRREELREVIREVRSALG